MSKVETPKPLTNQAIIDICGFWNLLDSMIVFDGKCEATHIKVIQAEHAPLIDKLWREWSGHLPGYAMRIDDHLSGSRRLKVLVLKCLGPETKG